MCCTGFDHMVEEATINVTLLFALMLSLVVASDKTTELGARLLQLHERDALDQLRLGHPEPILFLHHQPVANCEHGGRRGWKRIADEPDV